VQHISALMDDHETMNGLADRLIHLARSNLANIRECDALMRNLGAKVAAHRAVEGSFLLNDELRVLRDEFAEFSDSCAVYLGKWISNASGVDGVAFAQETGDMMTALKLQIERESRALYPMALETGS
jgi:hypothetical protein